MKALGSLYYDDVYIKSKDYQNHYKGSPYYNLWEKIVSLVKLLEKPMILEVGCGTGQLAHYLWDEGYKQYFGFDFSQQAVKIAKDCNNQRFFVGNAYDKSIYEFFSHNTIIVSEVLEHLDDDVGALKKMKSGVNIIFSLPMFNCKGHVRWFRSADEIRKRYKDCIDILDIVKARRKSLTKDGFVVWFVGIGRIR